MEVVAGIHLVDCLRGGNAYLIADQRLVLVDTGMPGNGDAVLDFMRRLGRQPHELEHIVLTHGHIDHAGSAAELRRLTGARVVAHVEEGTRLDDGTLVLRGDATGETRPLLRAVSPFGRFQPCPIDVPADDGDELASAGGIRILHTPGHTPGSISIFAERCRVLFVGDAIVSNRDRLSRPLPFGAHRGQSEQSLRKLAQLHFDVCCFGHGVPVTAAADELVRALADNPPETPLLRRVIFRRRDLAGFGLRLRGRPRPGEPHV